MEVYDNYNELMKDSIFRNKALEMVISEIQLRSKRQFSDETKKKIKEVLSNYEVEDGVSVFMTPEKPIDKTYIAKIDCGREYVTFWWGENRKANINRYALGLTFSHKGQNEVALYKKEELCKEFPDFADYFSKYEKGKKLKLVVYAKAGSFYKDAKDVSGEWLLQTPQNKSFIPSKAIGKIADGNVIYIFQPNNNIRANRYVRNIEVI